MGKYTKCEGHYEGKNRQERPILRLAARCIHNFTKEWNKLKAPSRRRKDAKDNSQYSEVLHLLSHGGVPERSKQNEKVHNKEDDGRHTKEHPNEKNLGGEVSPWEGGHLDMACSATQQRRHQEHWLRKGKLWSRPRN